MDEKQRARLRVLAVYTVSVVIVIGLARLYAAYSRSAADAQWYFLTPPIRENTGASNWFDRLQPEADAPLWRWEISESYGSQRLCEAARARQLAKFAKESESWKARVALDRCVAANARGVPHSDYWWHVHPEHLIDMNPPPSNALTRLLNHVAADSRTHPGMSLAERIFELWMPLLFLALIVCGLIDAVARPIIRKDWQSAAGSAGAELVLLSVLAFIWFANSEEPSWIQLSPGLLIASSGMWLVAASNETEEKRSCWVCAALQRMRGAQYRCPISRALHPSFSELTERATRKASPRFGLAGRGAHQARSPRCSKGEKPSPGFSARTSPVRQVRGSPQALVFMLQQTAMRGLFH
jgi:hypothetical protein